MSADFSSIKKEIQDYLEAKLDLFRLSTAEAISRALSNMIAIFVFICLLSIILLFLSFAAGYYFASLLGSDMLGFLVVAGFYALVLIIMMVFRKQIIDRPVIKAVVRQLFPKSPDDEK